MTARTDYERVKDHVYEDGAPGLSGQCLLPPVSATEAARDFRSNGQQIVVPSLF